MELLPASDRTECVKRAGGANGYGYSVLYTCVIAAQFRLQNRDKADRIAEAIARQNGRELVEPQTVGSIR
jgi:hypothetical protein